MRSRLGFGSRLRKSLPQKHRRQCRPPLFIFPIMGPPVRGNRCFHWKGPAKEVRNQSWKGLRNHFFNNFLKKGMQPNENKAGRGYLFCILLVCVACQTGKNDLKRYIYCRCSNSYFQTIIRTNWSPCPPFLIIRRGLSIKHLFAPRGTRRPEGAWRGLLRLSQRAKFRHDEGRESPGNAVPFEARPSFAMREE